MIIPVKCFTCGCVLADKYRYYQNEVRRIKKSKLEGNVETATNIDKVVYFTKKNMEKTPEGMVMDKIKLTNVCCRRHILTHVDIE
jgi:DNA-directed RNA polymerase I, II, and III subunit RPABC5